MTQGECVARTKKMTPEQKARREALLHEIEEIRNSVHLTPRQKDTIKLLREKRTTRRKTQP